MKHVQLSISIYTSSRINGKSLSGENPTIAHSSLPQLFLVVLFYPFAKHKQVAVIQQLTAHPLLIAIPLLLPSPICGSVQVRSHSLEHCPRSNYNNVLFL